MKQQKKIFILPIREILMFLLIGLFLFNQLAIIRVSAMMNMDTQMAVMLGMSSGSAKKIWAPKLNPDGKTTYLYEWPTITEVPGNPHSGNGLEDAEKVMQAKGKPFYAPEDISFDDPVNAQKKWSAMATSVKLTTEQEQRYERLIMLLMTCSYCCGEPNNVTKNKNCGCAHANAVRGFYRYMIQNYGNQYSDDELVGESHRWYALWYPKGMMEDYLLAIGDLTTLPHETHGGAGADGMHGLTKK